MTRMKYIFTVILSLLAFAIIGERYVQYLYTFQDDFPKLTVYLQSGQDEEEMKSDIVQSASELEIEVFFVKSYLNQDGYSEIDVYGTDGTTKNLKKKASVRAGAFSPLFSNSTVVSFLNIADYEMNTIGNGDALYIIGDDSHARDFASALANYTDGELFKPKQSIEIGILIGIWLGVYCMILLFTLFDNYRFQKEKTIRIVGGQSMSRIILEKMACDDVILTFCVAIGGWIMNWLSDVRFWLNISVICFLGFLVINSLSYAVLIKFDIKKAFANAVTSKNIMNFLYVTKGVMGLFFVLMTALNFQTLQTAVSYSKQDNFFSAFSDASYVKLIPPEVNQENVIEIGIEHDSLYEKLFENYKANAIVSEYCAEIKNITYMKMNYLAFSLQRDNIEISSDVDMTNILSGKNVILIPSGATDGTKYNAAGLSAFEEYTFVEYTSCHVVCIGADEMYLSSYEVNPVILLSDSFSYINCSYVAFHVSNDEIHKFIAENAANPDAWNYLLSNVQSVYQLHKEELYHAGILSAVLSLLLYLLLAASSVAIIQIYFSIHVMEIVIRYILGIPRMVSVKKLVLYFIIVDLSSAFIISVLLLILDLALPYYAVYGLIASFVTNAILVMYLHQQYLKKNTVKALKGGAL